MMEQWSEKQASTVDRYLAGNFTKEDENLIHQWRDESELFDQEFNDYKEVYQSLGDTALQEYIELMKKAHDSSKFPKIFSKPWMWVVMFLLTVGVAIVLLTGGTSWNNVQADFAPLKENISLRVASSSDGHLLADIEDAFNSENYKDVVLKIDEVLMDDPENYTLQLYKGRALYFNNEFEKAAKQFGSISRSKVALNSISEEARWWLALSLLAQRKKAELMSELEKLVKANDKEVASKARSLLQKMKNLKQ